MRQGESYPYAIVKHSTTLGGGEIIDIVKGLSAAERAVDAYNERLTQEEKDAGWGYFLKRTTQRPPPRPRSRRGYKPGPRKR
jgi:hypothetical protein